MQHSLNDIMRRLLVLERAEKERQLEEPGCLVAAVRLLALVLFWVGVGLACMWLQVLWNAHPDLHAEMWK